MPAKDAGERRHRVKAGFFGNFRDGHIGGKEQAASMADAQLLNEMDEILPEMFFH